MGKTIGIIIGVIVLVAGAGAGGFYGGTIYQQQQQANIRSQFFNGRGGGYGGGGGGGGGGGVGFGGGVFGTVKSVNGNTIPVSTAQNVTTVNLNSQTVILKTVSGAPADITVGEQITARGQRDSSGNVTATNIQVLPAGTTFGGRGGGGGGGGDNGGGAASATATP